MFMEDPSHFFYGPNSLKKPVSSNPTLGVWTNIDSIKETNNRQGMTRLEEPEVCEVERVVGVVEDDEVRRVEEEEEGARELEGARRQERQETAARRRLKLGAGDLPVPQELGGVGEL